MNYLQWRDIGKVLRFQLIEHNHDHWIAKLQNLHRDRRKPYLLKRKQGPYEVIEIDVLVKNTHLSSPTKDDRQTGGISPLHFSLLESSVITRNSLSVFSTT